MNLYGGAHSINYLWIFADGCGRQRSVRRTIKPGITSEQLTMQLIPPTCLPAQTAGQLSSGMRKAGQKIFLADTLTGYMICVRYSVSVL